MQWLPVEAFDGFARSLAGGPAFEPRKHAARFGTPVEMTRARVCEGEDAVPYAVGTFHFEENCGLYLLAQYENERQSDMLVALLKALGLSGIGGKISSGYGRFVLEDPVRLEQPRDRQTEWLCKALQGEHSHYLLVSASLPQDGELDRTLAGASFALIRRGGFVQSGTYAAQARKADAISFLRPARYFPVDFAEICMRWAAEVRTRYIGMGARSSWGWIVTQSEVLQQFDLLLTLRSPSLCGERVQLSEK